MEDILDGAYLDAFIPATPAKLLFRDFGYDAKVEISASADPAEIGDGVQMSLTVAARFSLYGRVAMTPDAARHVAEAVRECLDPATRATARGITVNVCDDVHDQRDAAVEVGIAPDLFGDAIYLTIYDAEQLATAVLLDDDAARVRLAYRR